MNIYCKWNGNVMEVWRNNCIIADVEENGDDPVIIVSPGRNDEWGKLTFSEIEHIMDNWHHSSKK